ncbi:MAG: phenylalanine--tRNA ligase subunit alpha [Candidatus Micrarchaeota archaeon]|nr:phenylalanine--tRNA ligase subunit alpha [Candidatus Micrarchaeota archaeon]
MHKYETAVLEALRKGSGGLDIDALSEATKVGRDGIMWALENLKTNGFVEFKVETNKRMELTDEGRGYAENGLPEENLMRAVDKAGSVPVQSLKGEGNQIGLSWAKRKGFIEIKDGKVMLTADGKSALQKGIPESGVLSGLATGSEKSQGMNENLMRELLARKLITVSMRKGIVDISITDAGIKASSSARAGADQLESLDKQIIKTGKWKGRAFKPYDVSVPIGRKAAAKRHPLRQIMSQMRLAYTSMGFREISGPAIESSFWVFDSLFMPQGHPAREMQDTFYLSNPETLQLDAAPYLSSVKKAQETWWHQNWSLAEAKKAVLRTHTTSVSARYVYTAISDIVQHTSAYSLPIKRFSLGRVFRNENLDYRHLADLNMTDGIIIGKDLTLSNLFGVITKLYGSFGIKVKFKPSYFPFVEPGCEFYAYSENTKEWIEMGGAGLLREEITGIPRKDIRVLAWGAGLERILLIKDRSLKSVTELYGSGIGWLRDRKLS